jgi:transketolase
MNKTEVKAMRDALGESLLELAEKYPELVVLDADVSSSTQTIHFGKKYPERFFNVGVAEANMVDIAGGMAMCGLKPVASTFAAFLTLKGAEQIMNNICYNHLPVILAGGYAGLSDSFDGASHQSIADIAAMRSIPGLNVIVPADALELKQAMEEAMKLDGPVYLRICRNPTPFLPENTGRFNFGKIRKLKEGSHITIAATGIPVFMALQAAEVLEKTGISCEVLNISTIKPLDTETLIQSVKKTGRIITVEEHSILGGMGSAVAETLGRTHPVPIEFIGINDTFTETGPYDDLLAKYGISGEAIMSTAISLIKAQH